MKNTCANLERITRWQATSLLASSLQCCRGHLTGCVVVLIVVCGTTHPPYGSASHMFKCCGMCRTREEIREFLPHSCSKVNKSMPICGAGLLSYANMCLSSLLTVEILEEGGKGVKASGSINDWSAEAAGVGVHVWRIYAGI